MDYITKNKVQISYMDFRGLCVRWANYRDGRPNKFTVAQINHAYELKQHGKTYQEIEKLTGISISTQKRRFKDMT